MMGNRAIIVLTVFLTGCIAPAAQETSAQLRGINFDQFEIALSPGDRQTVVTGNFLGGHFNDLAVLQIGSDGELHLRIVAHDGYSWITAMEVALASGTDFVDVVNFGEFDRLLLFDDGEVSWFEPATAATHRAVEHLGSHDSTNQGLHYAGLEARGPADHGEVPHLDISRDLNGDGLDDLVMPDLDGFWISMQTATGVFSDPVKLGPAEPFRNESAYGDTRSYGEVGITPLTVPWYLSRLHLFDYDLDGRKDLVFWNEDHFEVYSQNPNGLFREKTGVFSVDVPFDADGIYSLIFGFEQAGTFALIFGLREKIQRTVLRTIVDVNGDRVPDLVTQSLEGRSILSLRSRYDVYFGAITAGGIGFARDDHTMVKPLGKAGGIEAGGYSSMWLQDFNGDGRLDVLRGDISIGPVAILRALLNTSISMQAELFILESGQYPDRATTTIKIKSDIDTRGGRNGGFFPFVLAGDFSGDQCSDVIVGRSRDQLVIYQGGPEPFNGKPQVLAIPLPGDERNSWLTDLNRDGKQDVLLHFPSATEPGRVTLLVAQ